MKTQATSITAIFFLTIMMNQTQSLNKILLGH